jgi:hypothetical protein
VEVLENFHGGCGEKQRVETGGPFVPHPLPCLRLTETSTMMHLLSSGAGCAFLPGSSALRQFPSATLSGRSAGCWRSTSKRQLSSARASTGGSGPGDSAGPVVAETSTVGDSLTREEGDSGDAGASSESSAGNQLSPVNPKIEKELKKVGASFVP